MMKAKFGRSSYISSELQMKCVDPGAKAVAIWMDCIAKEINKVARSGKVISEIPFQGERSRWSCCK